MDDDTRLDDPAKQPTTLNALSESDRLAVAIMLDEPLPLASWAANLRQGDLIRRTGRKFWAAAKSGTRVTILGQCRTCGHPHTFTANVADPKPLFPHYCQEHRTLPWAHTPKKPKKRRKRRMRANASHAIAPRQAVAGKWTRGDIVDQAGHLYLVLQGERAITSHVLGGRHVINAQMLGTCSSCATPFRFSTSAARLDDPNARLRRRCPQHASMPLAASGKRPVAWEGQVLRRIARAANMPLEHLVDVSSNREAVR